AVDQAAGSVGILLAIFRHQPSRGRQDLGMSSAVGTSGERMEQGPDYQCDCQRDARRKEAPHGVFLPKKGTRVTFYTPHRWRPAERTRDFDMARLEAKRAGLGRP